MSASAFKTEYESVCNAEQLRPRKEVLAACDAAAGIEAGAELRVNGNAPARSSVHPPLAAPPLSAGPERCTDNLP